MKKKFIIATILVIFSCLFVKSVYASSLGIINQYKLTASPSSSGKLNMIYHFDMEIYENDVDQIYLKVPNSNFVVKSKCDLIKSIEPEDKYAVITLNKKYKAGEKFSLTFNLLQSNIYTTVESKNLLKYKFKIGNVKDFNIGSMKLQWAKKSVKFCQSGIESGNYYVIEREYSIIRNFNVLVEYDSSLFKLVDGEEKEFTLYDLVDNYFLVALGAFIVIAEIIAYKRKGCRY